MRNEPTLWDMLLSLQEQLQQCVKPSRGIVMAVNSDGTLDVYLDGDDADPDPDTLVEGCDRVLSYASPAVGDNVFCLRWATSAIVIGEQTEPEDDDD